MLERAVLVTSAYVLAVFLAVSEGVYRTSTSTVFLFPVPVGFFPRFFQHVVLPSASSHSAGGTRRTHDVGAITSSTDTHFNFFQECDGDRVFLFVLRGETIEPDLRIRFGSVAAANDSEDDLLIFGVVKKVLSESPQAVTEHFFEVSLGSRCRLRGVSRPQYEVLRGQCRVGRRTGDFTRLFCLRKYFQTTIGATSRGHRLAAVLGPRHPAKRCEVSREQCTVGRRTGDSTRQLKHECTSSSPLPPFSISPAVFPETGTIEHPNTPDKVFQHGARSGRQASLNATPHSVKFRAIVTLFGLSLDCYHSCVACFRVFSSLR